MPTLIYYVILYVNIVYLDFNQAMTNSLLISSWKVWDIKTVNILHCDQLNQCNQWILTYRLMSFQKQFFSHVPSTLLCPILFSIFQYLFPCLRGKAFFYFATEIFILFSSLPFMLAVFIPVTFNVIIDVLKFGYCFIILYLSAVFLGLPQWLNGKESTCNAGDVGLIPGEGNTNLLQCSCLGNPMDRGTQQATVHGVAEESTGLSN